MKNFNITKVYAYLGKALAGAAGGIIGFIVAGPILATPLIVVGVLLGTLLEKSIQTPILKNE